MKADELLLANTIFGSPSLFYNISKSSKYINNDMYSAYMRLPEFMSKIHYTAKPVIPRIMHYVWFTNENNPKQIPEAFLHNLKLELGKLTNYNLDIPEPWEVKFWVSCKACITPSLEHISEYGYKIEVMEWQSEYFGYYRSDLKKSATAFINAKNGMGAAYYIARYIIAEKYGGFLPDLSYNTGNSTEIIVRQGYHSITSPENYFFGFKPEHKLLRILNDELSNVFKKVEKYDMNSMVSSLTSYRLADWFGYGPFIRLMDLFLGKEDLSITPECNICDVDDTESQRSANPPEICSVGDHQSDPRSPLHCYIIIKDSLIDFGYDNRSLGSTWEETFQNISGSFCG